MRFARVKIKRDLNTVYSRAVPEWEIPILEFIFEEGNIERTGDFEVVTGREYPDAAAEFDRLSRVYGTDPENGIAYVAQVYGQAAAGVRALRQAIAENAENEGDVPAARRRTTRRPVAVVVEDDPLFA